MNECPELIAGEEFYMRAFWDLSTERQVSGGSIGTIPWLRAMEYACFRGVDEPMLPAFWQIISTMDAGFLDWQRTEHDRHVRASKPTKGNRSRSPKT